MPRETLQDDPCHPTIRTAPTSMSDRPNFCALENFSIRPVAAISARSDYKSGQSGPSEAIKGKSAPHDNRQ
jgi:hypothetical protein